MADQPLPPASFSLIDDWISSLLEFYRQKALTLETDELAGFVNRCESPIEKYMAVALSRMTIPYDAEIYPRQSCAPILMKGGAFTDKIFQLTGLPVGVLLYQQQIISGYRVDFLVVMKIEAFSEITKIIVECDGHDFHDRTKEQARRDKERDRTLTCAGYTVMRFTGSEIYADPVRCAAQVADCLDLRAAETAGMRRCGLGD